MCRQIEVRVPNARLATEVRDGDDPAIVLLHGMSGDRSTWDDLWGALPQRRRAVRYDLRGFGSSAALDEERFSHTEDLLSLLDFLEIGRCDLVGVSMGGSVSLNVALTHPDRVRRLVLFSPAITGWEWSPEWIGRWREVTTAARSGDLAGARELWWRHPIFDTIRDDAAAADAVRASIEAYPGDAWTGRSREKPALPDVERLPLLSAPTLLISGTEDLPDFRGIAAVIEASAPEIRRVDLPAAGHLVHLERAEEVTAQVRDFVA
ncbi:3-oxoadipate enol-lactone hydrolase [Enemella dayhoffiae]|uniref:3-oxoadipate enol-lactone hydrolase n=1 Tax=Enemella dayhoffiae TaxID=2016507 RepID=A0A255HBM2_9ACTN|nr:alpha/beta hydrolase [Enemella dayhoffiae]OYO24937.1 3-oxoadipate enol-lactone hydrolase [Enemella dayhoffiae]